MQLSWGPLHSDLCTMIPETTNLKEMKSILIVEDDPITTFITEKLLEPHFTVFSVKGGYEALSFLETSKVDAILMDINLGNINMDGIKTMHIIRNMHGRKHIKIIAVTAFSTNREWYIQQGFDDMLLKPLDEEKILHAINKTLKKGVQGKFAGVFSLN
jgi:CheY-like chemotaxis protein